MKTDKISKLNQKQHTIYGIVAFVLSLIGAGLAVAAILLAVYVSTIHRYAIYIGVVELGSILLTIISLIVAFVGQATEDTNKLYCYLAIGICGVLMLFHIVVLMIAYGN